MNDKIFDLTVPLTRQSRIFFLIAGVLNTSGGVLSLLRWEQAFQILGVMQLVSGLLLLVSHPIVKGANKYVIAFKDDHLEVSKGLYKSRTIPWDRVSKINVQLMFVDLVLAGGKARRIAFDLLDYSTHQEIKPKIVAAFREFAKAKQIPLTDGYEQPLKTVSLA